MEYESSRAIAEMKMEEAKRKAQEDASAYKLTGDIPDPNWAQPAETGNFTGVGLDQAQGFWINKGKRGGNRDLGVSIADFDHDLETLPKDGPKKLPPMPRDTGKITAEDADKLVKAREGPMVEQLNDAKNMSVDEYNVGVNIGPNGEPVYRRQFPQDEAIHLSATSLRISPR